MRGGVSPLFSRRRAAVVFCALTTSSHLALRRERALRSRYSRRGGCMNISITFRQMDATEAVKGYATDKVAKLQKYLRQPLHGTVTLSCQKTVHMAEVDLHSGSQHYHAHEASEDMYATIDKVVDKVERQ